jgi:hypothetical protein
VSAVYEGGEEIAQARALARVFLDRVQAVRGCAVSHRVGEVVPLVAGELVTNARTPPDRAC